MSATAAFTSAILPIVAIAAVGYLIGRRTGISVDPLNTVALNFFLPALVFHGIATTDLSGGTVLALAVGVVAYLLFVMGIAYVGARALSLPDAVLPGIVLAGAFPNSGFVGIPLTGFVFGDLGRTTATLFLTVQSVVLYTAGVYVVSAGADDAAGAASAVREVFRLPLVGAGVALAVGDGGYVWFLNVSRDELVKRLCEVPETSHIARRRPNPLKSAIQSAEGIGVQRSISTQFGGRAIALMVAAGIGFQNLSEGLAIGQSAASGAISLAFLLVIGFALDDITEGFGIAAPLSGSNPSYAFVGGLGLLAGGPTFVGTLIGNCEPPRWRSCSS